MATTYTAAVDNGSYGNFVRDSYGYGNGLSGKEEGGRSR